MQHVHKRQGVHAACHHLLDIFQTAASGCICNIALKLQGWQMLPVRCESCDQGERVEVLPFKTLPLPLPAPPQVDVTAVVIRVTGQTQPALHTVTMEVTGDITTHHFAMMCVMFVWIDYI